MIDYNEVDRRIKQCRIALVIIPIIYLFLLFIGDRFIYDLHVFVGLIIFLGIPIVFGCVLALYLIYSWKYNYFAGTWPMLILGIFLLSLNFWGGRIFLVEVFALLVFFFYFLGLFTFHWKYNVPLDIYISNDFWQKYFYTAGGTIRKCRKLNATIGLLLIVFGLLTIFPILYLIIFQDVENLPFGFYLLIALFILQISIAPIFLIFGARP